MQLTEMSFRQASVIVQGVVVAKEQGHNGVVKKCLCDSGAYGWSGVSQYKDYVESNVAFNLDNIEPGSLVSPWESIDKDAPELEELETPVNFADFHAYMTMSSVEVDAAYEKEIEEHVSDSVLANTKMRSLLLGKGKGAFVPNGKWEGLKGLEPLWPEGQQGL